MGTINLTYLHYLGFIYLAFAHQTDGVFSRDEQNAIWRCLKNQAYKDITHGEFAKIMDETMQWYKNRKINEDFQDEVFGVAEKMNDFEWFSLEKKMVSLKDLRQIALSDKTFLDSEKKWIREIAKIWHVNANKIRNLVK